MNLKPIVLMCMSLMGCAEKAFEEDTGTHLRWHVLRKVEKIASNSSKSFVRTSGLALTKDESILVLATSTRTSVALLDPETLKLKDEIYTGDGAGQIASVNDGNHLVTWAIAGRVRKKNGWFPDVSRATDVFILDGYTGQMLHKVKVGENVGMIQDLHDGTILVTAVHGARISRVHLETGKIVDQVSTRSKGFSPGYIATRPDNQIGVVTGGIYRGVGGSKGHARGTEVLVMDPMAPSERSRFEMVDGLKHPRSALFHPDGRHILIAERKRDMIVALDWVSMRTIDEKHVEHRPELLGMLPGGAHAYLSYDGAKRISRIHLATGTIDSAILPGTPRAWGSSRPVLSTDDRYLYVPIGDKDGIAVIELEDFALVDFIETPKDVRSLAMNRRGDVLFATLGDGNYVARIE